MRLRSFCRLPLLAVLLFPGMIAKAAPPAADALAAKEPRVLIEGWLDRPGCSDLYLYDLKGKRLQRLTAPPLPTCDIDSVSPDGRQVAFIANAGALHVLSIPHQLMSTMHAGNAQATAFLPDGSAIAFAVPDAAPARGATLHVRPVLAGAAIKASQTHLDSVPQDSAFAPDGKAVLFTALSGDGQRTSVFQFDLQTAQVQPLLDEPAASFRLPTFSPNGKRLYAIRQEPASHLHALVARDWPGGDRKTIATFPAGRALEMFMFADDGKRIAFLLDGVPGVMSADGQKWKGLWGDLPLTPTAIPGEAFRSRKAAPHAQSGRPLHVRGNHVAYLTYTGPQQVRIHLYNLATGEASHFDVQGHVGRVLLVE